MVIFVMSAVTDLYPMSSCAMRIKTCASVLMHLPNPSINSDVLKRAGYRARW